MPAIEAAGAHSVPNGALIEAERAGRAFLIFQGAENRQQLFLSAPDALKVLYAKLGIDAVPEGEARTCLVKRAGAAGLSGR